MKAVAETSAEQAPASFSDNGCPTLTLEMSDGRRYGWPLHLLACWAFSPGNDQRLELTLGDGESVSLRGVNLDEITEALDQGKGGQIMERDLRYLPLASKGRAFVTEISVKIPD
jgi:hypothetical protein